MDASAGAPSAGHVPLLARPPHRLQRHHDRRRCSCRAAVLPAQHHWCVLSTCQGPSALHGMCAADHVLHLVRLGDVVSSCRFPDRIRLAGVQIVFYFLYANVQIAFCFLLSCFFSKARTATVVGFMWVFGAAILANQLLEPFFIDERWFTIVLELIPTFGAQRCACLADDLIYLVEEFLLSACRILGTPGHWSQSLARWWRCRCVARTLPQRTAGAPPSRLPTTSLLSAAASRDRGCACLAVAP